MTAPQMLVFASLAATMALFLRGRFRHDVVALVALLMPIVVQLSGLLAAQSALGGSQHPAAADRLATPRRR